MEQHTKNFFKWIRLQPCCICHKGQWNTELGQWSNTVSHIKTKGSGGGDEGNVVSMCFFCHRKWEDSLKENKEEMLDLAADLYKIYLNVEKNQRN